MLNKDAAAISYKLTIKLCIPNKAIFKFKVVMIICGFIMYLTQVYSILLLMVTHYAKHVPIYPRLTKTLPGTNKKKVLVDACLL